MKAPGLVRVPDLTMRQKVPDLTAQAQAQITTALQTLEYYKFNVTELWRELGARAAAKDRGKPTEDAMRYRVPGVAPALADHLDGGDPQVLAAQVMWLGYHYSLTPGQRRWFREYEDMTPARTVTVTWVETWPGTSALKSFKIESDIHVDPQHRKHVLTAYVIRNATKFFDESAQYDREEVDTATLSLHVGGVNVWTSKHKWAVNDLTNTKFNGTKEEVEIVFVDENTIDFENTTTKQHVSVDKKEFLATVADYVRLFGKDGTGRGRTRARSTTTTIEDLMKEMANGGGVEV